MHNISNLFNFGTTLYMFWTVFPSIIRSLRLYIQHHTIQVLWLLASKQPQNLYDIYLMLYVQSLDSWWWTERPSETCRVLFQNKTNLRYCASVWFCYRNILRCRAIQTSNTSALLTTLCLQCDWVSNISQYIQRLLPWTASMGCCFVWRCRVLLYSRDLTFRCYLYRRINKQSREFF